MDYFEENKKNLIDFLASGCKSPDTPLCFGVELEHFVVDRITKETIPYLGETGVESIVKELKPLYTECAYSDGHMIGLGREGLDISLEPAAQLEVSVSPHQRIDEIKGIYDRFRNEIDPILDRYGYELMTVSYQPKSDVEDLTLLPKPRYRYMDQYFAKIGPYGRKMMRGTASTQVSIDYYSEEDFSKKYKAAYQLRDVLSQGAGLRTEIWNNTDRTRVDVAPFMKNGTLTFEQYIDFVLQTPVIVNRTGSEDSYDERTIGEIAKERIYTEEEQAHVLSMVFPMIRAKRFLELRYADSMPMEKVLSYVLVVKGLFMDIDHTLEWIFTETFEKMDLREKTLYMMEQIKANLSETEIKYIEENQIW